MINTSTSETSPAASRERELLVVDGVTMQFGGVSALDNVSMAVGRSQWHGLIGPNGSGKTTLLNVLSGIYIPTLGQIYMGGQDLSGYSPQARARLGIARTFQHPQVPESLTLKEMCMSGSDLTRSSEKSHRRASKAHGDTTDHYLDLFGCHDYRDHLPSEVPYGVRKKAELARAVSAEPSLLLLDEPAAGLSRKERAELIDSLKAVRTERPDMAVCLIEHDVQFVTSLCEEVWVLNDGRILASGLPEVVLGLPEVAEAYLGRGAV